MPFQQKSIGKNYLSTIILASPQLDQRYGLVKMSKISAFQCLKKILGHNFTSPKQANSP